MNHDTRWLDATDQAALVADAEATPLELVDEAISRIESLNPTLNAVIFELFDRARSEAAGELPDGPFRGVPFLLKDFLAELEGAPFAESTAFAGDFVSTRSQELVRRYRRAGFVICGKTNTPELGILPTTEPRRFGATKNPWDTTRTTGGSSGGSAAAVASGMVAAAHGNDGGGSIRIPASCCGLFGLKPTRGRVSLAPGFGDQMAGLVHEHVLTRSVRDSAAILDATHGAVPGDPYAAPAPRGASFLDATRSDPDALRLGILTASPTGSTVEPVCVEAVERTAALCERVGHRVEPMTIDANGDAFVEHFVNLWAAGNAWALGWWERQLGRAAVPRDVEPLTWSLVELGRSLRADQLLASIESLQSISRAIAASMEPFDAVLLPTLAEAPVPLGTFDAPEGDEILAMLRAATFTPFTPMFNVTGQPAASLPMHHDADGLPIGVQVAARFGDEETILSLAAQLERAEPWAHRHPATAP